MKPGSKTCVSPLDHEAGPYYIYMVSACNIEDVPSYGGSAFSDIVGGTNASYTGFSQIVAVIGDTNNMPSIRLHRAIGFTKIGIAKKIGFKFNKFIDVVYMQLDLTNKLPGL